MKLKRRMKRRSSEWTKRGRDARKLVGQVTRYSPTLLDGELKDFLTVKVLLEPIRFNQIGSISHQIVQV